MEYIQYAPLVFVAALAIALLVSWVQFVAKQGLFVGLAALVVVIAALMIILVPCVIVARLVTMPILPMPH